MATLYMRRILGSRHKPKTIPSAGPHSHGVAALMNHTSIPSACGKHSSLAYNHAYHKHNHELVKYVSQSAVRRVCSKLMANSHSIHPIRGFRMRYGYEPSNSIQFTVSSMHELPKSRAASLSPSPRSTCKSVCTTANPRKTCINIHFASHIYSHYFICMHARFSTWT